MFAPFAPIGAPNVDIWKGTSDQRFQLGMRIEAVDPTFGWGQFVYAKLASGTIAQPGRIVQLDGSFQISDNPNTANQGAPLFVSKAKMDASVAAVYGWVQRAGVAPVQSGTIAGTGAAYFAAAGTVSSTLTAGKQILNAKILQQPTYAITKSVRTQNGSTKLVVPSLDGLFIGMAVSGTGIAGGTTIADLESGDNMSIVLSAAATATGTVTGTFTYTGFGLLQFDAPFAQGIIT